MFRGVAAWRLWREFFYQFFFLISILQFKGFFLFGIVIFFVPKCLYIPIFK